MSCQYKMATLFYCKYLLGKSNLCDSNNFIDIIKK